jgi:hypothetical protein
MRIELLVTSLLGLAVTAGAQVPLGTQFTYQGRLADGAAPATGVYDFQFVLMDASMGGAQVGPTVNREDVPVTNGLFTVALDFGAVFGGSQRWLAIGVRPGASTGGYSALSPRQELAASPTSTFSRTAPWTGISGKPAGFADDTDDDALGALACKNGQITKATGSGWDCAEETAGTVTSVTAGTGLTGGTVTTSGTLAVDPTIVPQLGADNTFTGANTFSGLAVRGLSDLHGGVTMGDTIMRRMALGTGIATPSFQNTTDLVTSGIITRRDGILEIGTLATASALVDVRSNNGATAWGSPTTGTFLGFRAHFNGVSAAGHVAYVMYGGPAGVGSQIGGYGFRVQGTGGARTLEGVTFATAAPAAATVLLNANFGLGIHSLLAIRGGAVVSFYVDGTLLGTLPASGASTLVFPTYTVRLENNAAAATANMGVAFLTLGMPLLF